MSKWCYVLTFELEEDMIEEGPIKSLDKELLEKVREVAEKRGINKFDLIPVPCLLLPPVSCFQSRKKERDERG